MKKIDFQNLLDGNATILSKNDLKQILGAGEGYDSIGGEDPGDACLTSKCSTDNDCENKFCTKCVGASSQNEGSCATWR
ncbi:hypothetical protein ACJD0Z_09740 [Flavobacteriaceae bacterium M23B6Z8]